eukprot:5653450-Pleurochrysis_carterae.AAC.2
MEIESAANGGQLVPYRRWVAGNNKRLRRAQVHLGGRPRRSPIGAWRGLVAPLGTRVCAVTWRASWRRKFVRNPLQTDQRSSGWYVFAVDEFPAAVVRVIGDFGSLGGRPTGTAVA